MRPIIPLLSHLPILIGVLLFSLSTDVLSASRSALSSVSAKAFVQEEAALQTARDAERRTRLLEVPALKEAIVRQGEDKIILRRVERQVSPEQDLGEEPVTSFGAVEKKSSTPPSNHRPHKSLTLNVTVFDGLTEIRSIHGGESGPTRWRPL